VATATDMNVRYEWRFQAPAGMVNVPAVDGRVLGMRPGEAWQWVSSYPLPLLAPERARWAPDEPMETDLVGVVRELYLATSPGLAEGEGILVAVGAFAEHQLADHYRGALAVNAVGLGIGVEPGIAADPDDPMRVHQWQVIELTLDRDSPWDHPALRAPRVWREQIVGA
jgi:hypothetical protein